MMIISKISSKKIQPIATGSGKIHEILDHAEKLLVDYSLPHHAFTPFKTSHPIYAADHDERLNYAVRALMRPEESILWAIRGGCGTTSLLPELKKLHPLVHHWIIGFSDVTALHLMAYKLWDWVTIHGPTLNYYGEKLPLNYWQPMLELIQTGKLNTNLNNLEPLNEPARTCGHITGNLVGGNMSLIQTSIGSFWQLDARGKILFLEDTNEAPYRVAERFTHFQQAGFLNGVQAVLLGDFNSVTPDPNYDRLMQFVFTSFAKKIDIPVFANLPIGHFERNIPILHNYPCSLLGGNTGCFSQIFDETALS